MMRFIYKSIFFFTVLGILYVTWKNVDHIRYKIFRIPVEHCLNRSYYWKSRSEIIPTIVVGIMITQDTPVSTLNAFDEYFHMTLPLLNHLRIIPCFVVGNGARPKIFSAVTLMTLSIEENMNEGKTFAWIKQAVDLLDMFPDHPLSGIVKMDTDCCVDWLYFSTHIFPSLQNNYYIGTRNLRRNCVSWFQGWSHCPPSHCDNFTGDCWTYMSGGWYALSLDLARSVVLCPFAQSNTKGYEDVQTGLWIKSCVNHTTQLVHVHHVYNGLFFCHTKYITDVHIRKGCFTGPTCER